MYNSDKTKAEKRRIYLHSAGLKPSEVKSFTTRRKLSFLFLRKYFQHFPLIFCGTRRTYHSNELKSNYQIKNLYGTAVRKNKRNLHFVIFNNHVLINNFKIPSLKSQTQWWINALQEGGFLSEGERNPRFIYK